MGLHRCCGHFIDDDDVNILNMEGVSTGSVLASRLIVALA